MTITPLPARANLEQLKKRAKTLLKSVRIKDPAALDQVGPYFGDPGSISLQQAQLVIARSHGFSSWARLKAHVEGVQDHSGDPLANQFLDLVTVAYGDVPNFGPRRFEEAAALLAEHPEIAEASIYTAAAIGDAAHVARCLDDTPTLVNTPGGYFNWPPLMYAAYARLPGRSSFPAAQVLLARGADPNAHYMWGGQYKFTALTGVFGEGEGGPVNQPEHPDMVPFARALLDHGANPNDSQAAYNRCFTPDNTCLELLLEYGLSASDKNNWLLHENDRLVPNPSETMHFQLINAIRSGFVDRVKLLIAHGADLNKPADIYDNRTRGKTPYQTAMLMGQTEIAQLLVDAGANRRAISDADAFQVACMAGEFETAHDMLIESPDLIAQVRGREMLCDAVQLGQRTALDTMIRLGFDVNARPGRTPLHEAALIGDLEVVEVLLEAGADPTIREEMYFQPPIGWAIHAGQQGVIDRLDQVDMDIFTAAARGNVGQLEQRLSEDPTRLDMRFFDIRPGDNPANTDWLTPLAVAVGNNRAEGVRLLLERGADPSVNDGKGTDLLSLAKTHETTDILELLEKT